MLVVVGCGDDGTAQRAGSGPTVHSIQPPLTLAYEPVECPPRHAGDGLVGDYGVDYDSTDLWVVGPPGEYWPDGRAFRGAVRLTNTAAPRWRIEGEQTALLVDAEGDVVAARTPAAAETAEIARTELGEGESGAVRFTGSTFACEQPEPTTLDEGDYDLVVRIEATITGPTGGERTVTVDTPPERVSLSDFFEAGPES
ncbi:MAG: hypothetical protein S0880_34415 [Actinomycetota bacterium]|nr:hypothetical protein [Actinomycetota bacterium]